MTRSEQIRMFVLDAIADDYEEIGHISEILDKWFGMCEMEISRDEIVQALIALCQEGFARAYHLTRTSENKPKQIEEILSPDRIRLQDPYFWITDKGREEVNRPDSDWPLDDEGSLRKDWVPPRD